MSSLDSLKEEIHDVFMIFDEDEAGTISISEVTRALYTITGERTPRGQLLRLIAGAREALAKEDADKEAEKERLRESKKEADKDCGSSQSQADSPQQQPQDQQPPQQEEQQKKQKQHNRFDDNSDGIDARTFERVVLRLVNSRTLEEELAFTFGLLEDKRFPGFITKESLRRVAEETEEPLTEAEVAEMFDAAVTGIPSAAVDFTTFANIQAAARRAEDA